ncbi:hypothetical protein DOT66_23695 [Ralstonia pseudosolanacearum]|uniref:hypothetical protein n=1 Tax=Ralstonia pseudosolanacearum TaxID=1310165 RepID=UPI000DAB9713|nr:hypothetical protein [Ralstonia pseudosolanacearum]RAA04939.1 hypothetical protein DOT66_23695 [Ralstonia pseudosolanacearum]
MNATAVQKALIPLGIAVFGVFTVAERLYLEYPRVLANDVGTVDQNSLDGLRVALCNGEPLEVYAKTD